MGVGGGTGGAPPMDIGGMVGPYGGGGNIYGSAYGPPGMGGSGGGGSGSGGGGGVGSGGGGSGGLGVGGIAGGGGAGGGISTAAASASLPPAALGGPMPPYGMPLSMGGAGGGGGGAGYPPPPPALDSPQVNDAIRCLQSDGSPNVRMRWRSKDVPRDGCGWGQWGEPVGLDYEIRSQTALVRKGSALPLGRVSVGGARSEHGLTSAVVAHGDCGCGRALHSGGFWRTCCLFPRHCSDECSACFLFGAGRTRLRCSLLAPTCS